MAEPDTRARVARPSGGACSGGYPIGAVPVTDATPAAANALASVGVYRREVHASIARIWENVLDWEHLPWLHSESFSRIACEHEGPSGWRARVGLAPTSSNMEIVLELALERPALRYVARTLEGPGSGTEIWTRLSPLAPDRTQIEVEFLLPGIPPARREALGRAYVRLYTLLWDQDESMMTRREAELAARARSERSPSGPLPLGPLAALRPRLPLTVALGGRGFRVVEIEGELFAHATQCPHRLGPLENAPVVAGGLSCPWHGYRFDVRTGRSCDGRALRLASAPRVHVDPVSAQVELRFDS
jgi:nitrite reductase/ring-hydroxylating ferredoxin subunit